MYGMPKQQPVQDSNNMEKQMKKFLDDNPELKKSLKLFNVSEQEYTSALEAQNQKEQLTYTNSTGEVASGYLRANSK